jgi:hypothetical protein
MNTIVRAGNGQSDNNRATIRLRPPLLGPHTNYAFLVSASLGPLNLPHGAYVCGYDMDQTLQNVAAFEVYTEQAIAQFAWIVVQLG